MSARPSYCVIETWTDGSEHVWGPFSEHRAVMAADALSDVDGGVGLSHARVLPLLPSFPREWQRIIAAKIGPCRVCMVPRLNGGSSSQPYPVSFHHVVPKSLGGDDVPDNIVPLCGDGTRGCHGKVESFDASALLQLCAGLTDSEYAYVIAKLGESGPARLFGVNHGRT